MGSPKKAVASDAGQGRRRASVTVQARPLPAFPRAVFGARLSELRTADDLTQEQLAARVGVGQATVARYERGTMVPSLEVFYRILRVFPGTRADFLLGL